MNRTIFRALALGTLGLANLAQAAALQSISKECEMALATSAAPKHMREAAGIYVLGASGYERVRESGNGYECIVERNHHSSIVPQCFDASAVKANLQVILDEGELLRGDYSFEEIDARRQQALASGEYPVAGFGLAYMISAYNYVYDYDRETLLNIAPHLMFHAPNLTGADIGADPVAAFGNRGLPIMNAEGPHGLIVTFVESASDSSEVEQACSGQLPSAEDMTPFPAAF